MKIKIKENNMEISYCPQCGEQDEALETALEFDADEIRQMICAKHWCVLYWHIQSVIPERNQLKRFFNL